MIGWPAKDPAEARAFVFDLANRLGTDTIATASVVASGVTLGTVAHDATNVTCRLSGGTEGSIALATCTVVTAAGDTLVEVGVLPIGGMPISLEDAKAHLAVEDDDSQDVDILNKLRAAIGHVEKLTGISLTQRTIVDRFKGFPKRLALSRYPVRQLTAIDTLGVDGTPATVDPSTVRLIPGRPARLEAAIGSSWPVVADAEASVTVTYVAGCLPGEQPPEVIAAVLLILGELFANRERAIVGERTVLTLVTDVTSLVADHTIY
jgi:uncharacterized phiE125 gp8 family phage protein